MVQGTRVMGPRQFAGKAQTRTLEDIMNSNGIRLGRDPRRTQMGPLGGPQSSTPLTQLASQKRYVAFIFASSTHAGLFGRHRNMVLLGPQFICKRCHSKAKYPQSRNPLAHIYHCLQQLKPQSRDPQVKRPHLQLRWRQWGQLL